MDLVGYEEAAFTRIVREYSQFLRQIDVEPAYFVPVAGRDGDNVARRSTAMPWYVGPTVLEALDAFESERSPVEKPFRMPVQDVYKFTSQGDSRRIVAGTVETGVLRVGDEVVFYPSGKKSRVKSIEAFNAPPRGDASAGEATGFTLTEQVYVARGEVAALSSEPRPHVTTRLRVNLFWLGSTPLVPLKDYVLKLGTARAIARVEEIVRVIDASSLAATERRDQVGRHDVAECVLKLNRAVGFDLAHEIPPTGRFVLVDDFEIRGGGTVREALPDWQARGRDEGLSDDAWEPSGISPERRAEKYGQRATLVLVTGPGEAARNALARGLEARLFDDGTVVYCLGVENVRCAAGADVDLREPDRAERVRRLADVANLVLDTGVILIVTVAELTQGELELIKTRVDAPRVQTIWVGDTATTDVVYDVTLTAEAAERDGVERLHVLLEDLGAVCRGR
jgi:bifunctional enzyme CysN/CysC